MIQTMLQMAQRLLMRWMASRKKLDWCSMLRCGIKNVFLNTYLVVGSLRCSIQRVRVNVECISFLRFQDCYVFPFPLLSGVTCIHRMEPAVNPQALHSMSSAFLRVWMQRGTRTSTGSLLTQTRIRWLSSMRHYQAHTPQPTRPTARGRW